MNDIRAWEWTMKALREKGGEIIVNDNRIPVPNDVRIGVVYAPSGDNEIKDEAFEVFKNDDVHAKCFQISQVNEYAESAAFNLFKNDLYLE